MSAIERGLGRGLDALLQGFEENLEAPEVVLVPVDKIRANPNQPRRDFNEDALEELAASISVSGVLQPILVRPKAVDDYLYELVAGERRWRASQLAKQTDIPVIIKRLDDEESMAIALVENLQREDLNPMEEAIGLKHLQQAYDLTQEDLAQRVGKSRSAIANMLRLTGLPESIQSDIRSGYISAGHGRSLLAIENAQSQDDLRQRIVSDGLSVREAEAQASYFKRTGHLPGSVDSESPITPKSTPAKAQPTAEMTDLCSRAESVLGVPVKFQGTLSGGKIILPYTSEEQLSSLLKTLGIEG